MRDKKHLSHPLTPLNKGLARENVRDGFELVGGAKVPGPIAPQNSPRNSRFLLLYLFDNRKTSYFA